MASKYDLQRDNSYLESLKSDLNSVVSNLEQSSSNVNKLYTVLGSNYKIQDDDVKSIPRSKKLEKDINNEIDYIKNTVIPEIGNQIDANNAEIRRIEEEERRRREEEERRRKEEENKKKSNSSVTSGWR
jgi:hypothetical protein